MPDSTPVTACAAAGGIFTGIFELNDGIRYVARYADGRLAMAQRDDFDDASAAESDKYEELFVNPSLLKLAGQRGRLDCGGLRFVVVGYGNFNQLVIGLPDGHVSVCFQHGIDPIAFVDPILAIAAQWPAS